MALPRRLIGLALFSGAAACLLAFLTFPAASAQDQAPSRHELTIVGKDFRWAPDRIEVRQEDLVRLTIRSEDIPYSFTIDEYRIVRRVPAGGTTTFEFRAERVGTFRFYSNLTSDSGHAGMEGRLVVTAR
jgi:heme/copper-type cytochrome/quinol oxidase subunit 2